MSAKTGRGRLIADGIARKKAKKEEWAAINKARSDTLKRRASQLTEDQRLDEKQNRVEGTKKFHADPTKHRTWKNNLQLANRTFKLQDKVHLTTIPSKAGDLLGYVRGYEWHTIQLMEHLFSSGTLISWDFRNDVMFPMGKRNCHSRQFYQSLQSPRVPLGEQKDHDIDHSLSIKSASDIELFCNKMGELFQVNITHLFAPIKQGFLVTIETKSFSNEKAHCKDGNWFSRVQTKATEPHGTIVEDQVCVYLLIEINPGSMVLYSPTRGKLTAIGIALYQNENSLEKHQKYFRQVDQIDELTVTNYGILPWSKMPRNDVENVTRIEECCYIETRLSKNT